MKNADFLKRIEALERRIQSLESQLSSMQFQQMPQMPVGPCKPRDMYEVTCESTKHWTRHEGIEKPSVYGSAGQFGYPVVAIDSP